MISHKFEYFTNFKVYLCLYFNSFCPKIKMWKLFKNKLARVYEINSNNMYSKIGAHFTNYETSCDCCVRTFQTKPNYLQAVATRLYSFPPLHSRFTLFLPSPLSARDRIRIIAKCENKPRHRNSTFSQSRNRPAAAPAKLSSSFPKVVPQIERRFNDFPFSQRSVYSVFMDCTFLRPAVQPCTQHIRRCRIKGVPIIFSFILTRHLSVRDGKVLSAAVWNKVAAVINEVDKPEGQAWKETKLPTTNFISLVGLNY